MKLFSAHIPFETLADLAEGRAAKAEREAAAGHLSTCSTCAAELNKLESVIALMHTDDREDAPRDLLSYVINMFQQKEAEPSILRRLVATLSFDSMTTAPAFGFRSTQAESRQLLYSAEENDIDLRITPQNDLWMVVGQVLRPDCAGGQVELAGATGSVVAGLNDLCEFTLPPVSAGKYSLRVKTADVEIEVPELELKG
jgi:anti-sigma factor RsiW